MQNHHPRSWAAASLVFAAFGLSGFVVSARALVGPSQDGAPFAAHVVMVLASRPGQAGFCSGVVLAADVVLTAAHCVEDPPRTRIYVTGPGSGTAMLPVAAVAAHPLYRADAARLHARSIDLALVRLAEPLPSRFSAVTLAEAQDIHAGDLFRIAGFGVADEKAPTTGGRLRSGTLAARAPLSSILLWATDPRHRDFGACTGDSGAPIFSADGMRLVAIVDWAQGRGRRACGELTQAALLAPQRAWIDATLRRWMP